MSTRRQLVIAAGSVPMVSLWACASDKERTAASPQAAGPPQVSQGERWTYESTNRYNGAPTGGVVATVLVQKASELRIGLAKLDGTAIGEELYDGPWRVVRDLSFDREQVFEAPVPLIPSRLVVGAAESLSTYYQTSGNALPLFWSQRLKVIKSERLAVPAGEFDCLRIERIVQFQHSDIFRQMPDRTDIFWYAPSVNRWVQREWTGSYSSGRRARLREDWVRWRLLRHEKPSA